MFVMHNSRYHRMAIDWSEVDEKAWSRERESTCENLAPLMICTGSVTVSNKSPSASNEKFRTPYGEVDRRAACTDVILYQNWNLKMLYLCPICLAQE